ncbi:septum formation inhibitor Maf [Candidatus Kuenenbacteria bacterium]|nr:septum formation inhibitor Maf [Candidatus Kuenenbacteria bacterium]
MSRQIILASKSPRRKRLLEQIGVKFTVHESAYEEDMHAKDDPYELAKFLALKKAQDVARHYPDAIVIGADTFTVYQGKFVGKPKDAADAKSILQDFSGNSHEVVTGFAVIDTRTGEIVNGYGKAESFFRELTAEEIDAYIATGEPFDMAGAYGFMDKGAVLMAGVKGDFYSIIGLPITQVYLALKKMGVKFWEN